ncbi:hypothetical protein PC9H_008964 [Pleurotus ostreatus]|uniref:Uncharacterized protein n=2 Tax=Pleurotus ostreatus TaxID=5322 RepID=A0A067NWC7_PLEO1|nr:uncharacterized protein PC9H_008964 [Pleurotus ostreatus]KAF7426595.1 hypothetical protein PC9H_008964 [Pleurotus ostreatus]KDQ32343.1 hypothetical protein PLEOSDRAFT_1100827 [Pleurotus ostreatus PC15]
MFKSSHLTISLAAMVEVHGEPSGRADVELHRRAGLATAEFLGWQIVGLTRHAEARIMSYVGGGRPKGWDVADAPVRYSNILKKSNIGRKIEVVRLECKFKMSREKGGANREGVVDRFCDDIGRQIGDIVKQHSKISADNGILLCVCVSVGAVGDASGESVSLRLTSGSFGQRSLH